MKENICTNCNKQFDESELTDFEGRLYCQSCLTERTIICRDCGRRIDIYDNSGTSEYPICQDCYDDHYSSCERCGRLIHNDDAYYIDSCDYPYCHSCYEIECKRSIKEYNYKPNPIFYGEGNRFFGVELEVDEGGEEESAAAEILFVSTGNVVVLIEFNTSYSVFKHSK